MQDARRRTKDKRRKLKGVEGVEGVEGFFTSASRLTPHATRPAPGALVTI